VLASMVRRQDRELYSIPSSRRGASNCRGTAGDDEAADRARVYPLLCGCQPQPPSSLKSHRRCRASATSWGERRQSTPRRPTAGLPEERVFVHCDFFCWQRM